MFYLFVDTSGNVEIPRLGNSLEPSCNVHSVAIDVIRFDNYVPKIHSNSILYPVFARERRVTPHHALLDDDGAPNGFDRALEHSKKTVPRTFHEPSVVLSDRGLNELAPKSHDPRVCPLLIDSHESAIAGDISGHDSCETPRRSIGWIGSIFPLADVIDLAWHLRHLFPHTEIVQSSKRDAILNWCSGAVM